jgi:hypothetical protein
MTTKKTATTAKKTTAKAATTTKTTAKKATTTKKTASKGAVAVAEPVAEATVTEKLVATMMPETPKTEITMEAVVAAAEAKAEIKAEVKATPAAPKQIVLTIGMFQKRLSELGLYDGPWDGVYGPSTKHAAARFQAGKGLKVNGDANPETLAALGLDLYKTY